MRPLALFEELNPGPPGLSLAGLSAGGDVPAAPARLGLVGLATVAARCGLLMPDLCGLGCGCGLDAGRRAAGAPALARDAATPGAPGMARGGGEAASLRVESRAPRCGEAAGRAPPAPLAPPASPRSAGLGLAAGLAFGAGFAGEEAGCLEDRCADRGRAAAVVTAAAAAEPRAGGWSRSPPAA